MMEEGKESSTTTRKETYYFEKQNLIPIKGMINYVDYFIRELKLLIGRERKKKPILMLALALDKIVSLKLALDKVVFLKSRITCLCLLKFTHCTHCTLGHFWKTQTCF